MTNLTVFEAETISAAAFTGASIPPAQVHPTVAQMVRILKNENGAALAGLDLAKQLYPLCFVDGYKAQALPVLRQWVGFAIIEASNGEGVAAYRTYAPMLRWIMTVSNNTDTLMMAKEALADLYLEQTTADGNEWWADAYTGEIDVEAKAEMEANKTATAWLKADEEFAAQEEAAMVAAGKVSAAYAGKAVPVVAVNENSLTASIMAAYEDPKMARKAIRATQSPIGDLPEWEDVDFGEDREYVPPTLTKEFNPDMSIVKWEVVNEFRSWKSACWKHAWNMVPEDRDADKAKQRADWTERMAAFRTLFNASKSTRSNLFWAVKEWSRMDPQAAAVAIFPFIVDDELAVKGHHYGWSEESARYYGNDAGLVEIEDTSSMAGVDFVMDEMPIEVAMVFDLFESEIADRVSGSQTSGGYEDIALVNAFVQDYLKEIDKTLPEMSAKPDRTRSFNVAYVAAISANSTPEEATATAWYAWRKAMSLKGCAEFEAEMLLSKSQGKAWAAFWKFAPTSVPRPQSEILSMTAEGMKISLYGKERTITWAVAAMKLAAGELDLTKAEKMIAVLQKRQWPFAARFLREIISLRAKQSVKAVAAKFAVA